MQKIVRKRKIRQDDLGKGTQFKCRHSAGEFQDVSQERLNKFKRRFVLTAAPTMSISTGTPSNIVYHTPSDKYGTPRSNDPNSSRAIHKATIEFNNSREDIFSSSISSSIGHQANSLTRSIGRSSVWNPSILFRSAHNDGFKRDYSAAREKYHLAYLGYKSSGASR
ncbi:hypothetical protein GQ44DRAFT_82827 [Phaeosphaeriaceae sp. PMI808]|nr:hypothetical protein GQ44DRAFT_82827 [Phaeosphaeriaceae sp. PMI808]